MNDDQLFQAYLDGKLQPGQALYNAVRRDPHRYGALILKMKQFKEKNSDVMAKYYAELAERQYEFTPKVSGESNAAATTAPETTNPAEPKRVSRNRKSKGQTEGESSIAATVKARRRVSKEVRVQDNGQEQGEEPVFRCRCRRNPCEGLGRVLKFW
jgi:hypothetical protein